MAAAAVVVAVCFLFSWVYLDDGDGNAEFRAEQVGDYVVWENHLVRADGTTEDDASVQTLVAVVGDTRLQCVEYGDGTSDYYWDTVGFEESMEHIGTETVAIDGLGVYECDILRGEYEGIYSEMNKCMLCGKYDVDLPHRRRSGVRRLRRR